MNFQKSKTKKIKQQYNLAKFKSKIKVSKEKQPFQLKITNLYCSLFKSCSVNSSKGIITVSSIDLPSNLTLIHSSSTYYQLSKPKSNETLPNHFAFPKNQKSATFTAIFFNIIRKCSKFSCQTICLIIARKLQRLIRSNILGVKNFFNENYRHIFWYQVIENQLNLSEEYYSLIESQLKSFKKSNKPINNILSQDLRRMDVRLQIDQTRSVLSEIQKCLQLFQIYRPDVGYIQGMTYIAWMMVIRMNSCSAFICFSNIMLCDPFMNSLYQFRQEKIRKITNFFQVSLNDKKHKLLKHMKSLSVEFELFLIEWAYTFFTRAFNLRISSKIWDLWFTEGYNVFFKVCITIMQMLEGQILQQNENDRIIQLIRTATHRLDQQIFVKLLLKQKLFEDLNLKF